MFLLVLVPTLLLSAGVVKLRVSAETRVLAGPESPVRLSLERFEQRFSQNNNLLFVIAPGEGGVFSAETLRAIDAITERAWRLPFASRVDSITNFPLIVAADESFGVVSLAEAGLPQTPEQLDAAAAQVMAEPWVAGLLLDEQARTTGVNVLFIIPPEATEEIAEIMSAVGALQSDIAEEFPGITLYVTGNIALMNAFADSARRDVAWLIPAALVLVVMIAFLFLRDVRIVAVLAIYLVLCCLGAMGTAGWLGHVLNPATVAAPIIIMTLGLASIIHLMSSVQTELTRGGSVPVAVDAALKENRYPITVTIVTTAFGFMAMNAAASPPLRMLGNIVVMGLVIALGIALFVVPMVLRYLAIKPRPLPSRRALTGMIEWVNRRRVLILAVTTGLTVLAATGIFQIRLDDDFIRYFDQSFSYRVASDYAEDNLTGLNILEFAFEAGEPHGINEPDYMARLDAFAAWLWVQPGVVHVTTLSDKLKQINNALQPDAPRDQLPQSRELIAQYLLLFELSLPSGNDIADRINADRSATRITAMMRHVTSADIRALNERAEVWLAENNPIPEQRAGNSINYFFATLSLANITSMIGGTVLALVFISLIVLVALQDIRLGAISLVANVIPLIVGFGLWGYFVGEIGLASSVVVAMTFGIVVDDTIHLLIRFKNERALGVDTYSAMKSAYVNVGRAVVITSVALGSGFLLLMASGFEINSSLGLFTTIIVMSALVIVLTLVPALVLVTSKN